MKSLHKSLRTVQLAALLLLPALPATADVTVPFKGRVAVQWEFTVNLVTLDGVGAARFVTANQDELLTESTALAIPTDTADVFVVVEQHTITGGSGRFAGATGSFRLERLVNTATGVTAGSFDGTLVLAKTK
jgi:hypothetical protein